MLYRWPFTPSRELWVLAILLQCVQALNSPDKLPKRAKNDILLTRGVGLGTHLGLPKEAAITTNSERPNYLARLTHPPSSSDPIVRTYNLPRLARVSKPSDSLPPYTLYWETYIALLLSDTFLIYTTHTQLAD